MFHSSYANPEGSFYSLHVHFQCASQRCSVTILRSILQTWNSTNLVWHLCKLWHDLHDTATDRRGNIDLKSCISKIRFLWVLAVAGTSTSVVIRAHQQTCVGIKALMMETTTTSSVPGWSWPNNGGGPVGWPHVPFLLPKPLTVITETFLSSASASPQASPLIPVKCLECWTGEPGS